MKICDDCAITDQLQVDQKRIEVLLFSLKKALVSFHSLLNERMSIHAYHTCIEKQIETLSDMKSLTNNQFLAKYMKERTSHEDTKSTN